MNERFLLEHNEAAPDTEAAFLLDQKTGLKARIIRFRTLKQLDIYEPSGFTIPIRNLPILLEALPSELSERNINGVLKRMVDWYYYTQLKQPPTNTPPASESAG